ncbi:putative ABC exporter domain-containing protein [Stakelama saccharophila]|uniref:ABC exporter domain-containing protein n=1 Tax=Stakelama saccharophila TaxID=3075605 RepID=A0ABZ0BE30_9SPHN|nr:putative ABC exporter domain-containing protein [Stakelama sp. W311]WNO54609.1 putative ABC exporter domain-containing protein [Stakelama sp. W311]
MTGWLMRRLPAPSLAWLLLHEIRVGFRSRAKRTRLVVLRYVLLAGLIAFGIFTGYLLRATPIPENPTALVAALTAVILMFSFMVTQAMLGAQRTLYESGDLDLMLSAPIGARTVMLAKLLGIAATIMLSFAAFILSFILPIAVFGHPKLFGTIIVLVSCALVAASLGLGLTLLLARISGPRAARTVGQIVAGLLGGALFLASQLMNDHDDRESRMAVIFRHIRDSGVTDGWWGGLPGRATFGEPGPMLAMLAGAILVFVITGYLFQRWFVRGVQDAANHGGRGKVSRKGIARHFRPTLFGAVFRKESRLLLRDPAIAFSIVLRLVYLAPLMFVGFRSANGVPVSPMLSFLSVAIAGQLVGSFTWLAISAEDSPDLITIAPVEKALVDRAKLASALAIAAPIALILPIAILTETLLGAVVTVVFTGLGGVAAGGIELKFAKPADRKRFAQRRQGSILTRILTLIATGIIGLLSGAIVYFLP